MYVCCTSQNETFEKIHLKKVIWGAPQLELFTPKVTFYESVFLLLAPECHHKTLLVQKVACESLYQHRNTYELKSLLWNEHIPEKYNIQWRMHF